MPEFKPIDPKLLTQNENKWIAVSPDGKKLLASADNPPSLFEALKKVKLSYQPLITWVLPRDVTYASYGK